jgi:hypothetical protein
MAAAQPRRLLGPERGQPLRADGTPGARPPRRPRERLAEGGVRLQVVGQVARGEHEDARRRGPEQVLEVERVELACAQRQRLPRVVGRRARRGAGRARPCRDERSLTGAGVDQAPRGEGAHGALDGDRPGAVPAHQLADRREPVAGATGCHRGLELFQNAAARVIVVHEHGR